jgi:transcriptional regulator with XRE-family HTH domain
MANKTLYDHRIRAGVTQAQLAEACGVTQEAVSAWEAGVYRPDASRVTVIASTLGIRFRVAFKLFFTADGEEK